jgi:Flp pilus assembly protein TadG
MVFVAKQRKKHRRGAMAVEAALVFPLLLLLTLGAIRYGGLFLKAQQITNAARMGARIAILPDSSVDDVQTSISNLMNSANINPDDCTVTITPTEIYDLDVGDSITVQVTVPCEVVDIMHVPLFTDLEPNNWSLGAEVTMAKEGY